MRNDAVPITVSTEYLTKEERLSTSTGCPTTISVTEQARRLRELQSKRHA